MYVNEKDSVARNQTTDGAASQWGNFRVVPELGNGMLYQLHDTSMKRNAYNTMLLLSRRLTQY